MESRVWQPYVAVACSQAFKLDVRATEELLRCIEALLAATPVSGSASVKVFLEGGVGQIAAENRDERLRIDIRLRKPSDSAPDGPSGRKTSRSARCPASDVPSMVEPVPLGKDARAVPTGASR